MEIGETVVSRSGNYLLPSILEPGFDLDFSQGEGGRQLDSFVHTEVLVYLFFALKLWCEGRVVRST